jgi:aminopeptidase N
VVATLPYSRRGEGLHRFVDPVDERVYLYSQFEVPDARRMYTTFDSRTSRPASSCTWWRREGGRWSPTPPRPSRSSWPTRARRRSRWRFAPTGPLSTYVTALVAGEYHVSATSTAATTVEIPLGSSAASRCRAPRRDEILEVTKQGFAFFEEAFAMPYPFGKYDQLFVPEYNMGRWRTRRA